jgi:hypothetical protein
MDKDWTVQVRHALREVNKCADFFLLNMVRQSAQGERFGTIYVPPLMGSLLLKDCLGVNPTLSL